MKITKAVIPVAGYGTRMFPMTKAFSKEFLPVRNSKGEFKPAIMYLLEELDSSGIEEIYIIVSKPYQKSLYEHFFYEDVDYVCLDNFSKNQVNYLKTIKRIGKKIKVLQRDMPDLGYVLYHCNDIIGKRESFLLLLGDQIYKSCENDSCIKQIINNYDGDLMLTASKTPLDDVSKYGIMYGDYISDNKFMISSMKEKPTKLYAKKHLKMTYQNNDTYFCVFGTYVLNHNIVEEAIKFFNNKKTDNKYELTSFLDYYKGKKYAFIPNGKYFDIGNPNSYNNTYTNFSIDEKLKI